MATTIITCPKCQVKMKVDSQNLGKTIRCPKCSETFRASIAGDSQPAPQPQQQSQGVPRPAPEGPINPQAKKPTKKAVVLTVVGIVIVILVLARVFSGGGDPKTASDEDILKAFYEDKALEFELREKDADYAAYKVNVENCRKIIIMSGAKTCEEYVEIRKKQENNQAKWAEQQRNAEELQAKLREKEEKVKEEYRPKIEAAIEEVNERGKTRSQVELAMANLYDKSTNEYSSAKSKYDIANQEVNVAEKKLKDLQSELASKVAAIEKEVEAAREAGLRPVKAD